MQQMITEIHRILNYCKDFISGYNSSVKDKMVIAYKGSLYKVTFEELDTSDRNIFEEMHEYLYKLR